MHVGHVCIKSICKACTSVVYDSCIFNVLLTTQYSGETQDQPDETGEEVLMVYCKLCIDLH